MHSVNSTRHLQSWQVIAGGICSLLLTVGMARFAYTPMIPHMQTEAGLGILDSGWLATANYLGYMTGAALAAWIDDPRWRLRLYTVGLLLGVISTLAMGNTTSVTLWALWRYLGGLSGAAGMLLGTGLILGWLMRHGHRPELGLHFTGLGGGIALSALAAQTFVWLDWPWNWQWWGYGTLAFVCWIPAMLLKPDVAPVAAVAVRPMQKGRWMLPMVLMYFCAGVGFAFSATYMVTLVESLPGLAGQGPLAWLVVGLASIPAVYAWDRLARAMGTIVALGLALAMQMLSVVLPALMSDLWVALLSAALFGGTFTGIVSMTLAFVGQHSPSNPGKAMARLTLSYGVAQVVTPTLTALVLASTGNYQAPLWMTALFLSMGIALLVWVHQRSRSDTP